MGGIPDVRCSGSDLTQDLFRKHSAAALFPGSAGLLANSQEINDHEVFQTPHALPPWPERYVLRCIEIGPAAGQVHRRALGACRIS